MTLWVKAKIKNLVSYCQSVFDCFIGNPSFILDWKCIEQCIFTSQYTSLHYIQSMTIPVYTCLSIYLFILYFAWSLSYIREHVIFVLLTLAYFTDNDLHIELVPFFLMTI